MNKTLIFEKLSITDFIFFSHKILSSKYNIFFFKTDILSIFLIKFFTKNIKQIKARELSSIYDGNSLDYIKQNFLIESIDEFVQNNTLNNEFYNFQS